MAALRKRVTIISALENKIGFPRCKLHRHNMKIKNIFEAIQAVAYLSGYNYIYLTSQRSFDWLAYGYVLGPTLILSTPCYLFYCGVRKLFMHKFHNKYTAFLTLLLAYIIISCLEYLFFSSRLFPDQPDGVREAFCRASIYSPIFILPFLALECLFKKEQKEMSEPI